MTTPSGGGNDNNFPWLTDFYGGNQSDWLRNLGLQNPGKFNRFFTPYDPADELRATELSAIDKQGMLADYNKQQWQLGQSYTQAGRDATSSIFDLYRNRNEILGKSRGLRTGGMGSLVNRGLRDVSGAYGSAGDTFRWGSAFNLGDYQRGIAKADLGLEDKISSLREGYKTSLWDIIGTLGALGAKFNFNSNTSIPGNPEEDWDPNNPMNEEYIEGPGGI